MEHDSEHKFDRGFKDARIQGASDLPKVAGADRGTDAGGIEIRVVRHVERLCAEFEMGAFLYGEVFKDGDVERFFTGALDRADAGVTEKAVEGRSEGRRTEPFRGSLGIGEWAHHIGARRSGRSRAASSRDRQRKAALENSDAG